MTKESKLRDGGRNNRALIAFMLLLVVVGFGLAGWFYMKNQDLKNNPAQTQQQAQANKAADVKAKVAKLIDVPKDETPTLATVTDKDKLKDQPFFKDAQNGDQILIFPQAKKALIYREKDNKLINVGPIAITSDAAQQQGTTDQNQKK